MTRPRHRSRYAAVAAYAATILLANYAIAHWGRQAFPSGPHTVAVWPGLQAPSGVLFVGLAFTLRDIVQMILGRWWTVAAIAVGAALSFLVAPSFALASAGAFLLSELLDFAVYTPLAEHDRWLTAVVLSNIAGTFLDTFAFLWLAFGSLAYWQGQVVGKLWMTLAAVAVLAVVRPRVRATVAA